MITTLLLLALAQDPAAPSGPTDKDAEAAVKRLKEAAADASDDAKINAIKEALAVRHETVIRAVGAMLASERETVVIGGVLALGDSDHPVAAEILAKSVVPRLKQAAILAATCRALGTIGWQNGVGPLVEVVKKVGDADIRPVVPEAMDALGAIGGPGGADAIIDLLHKLDGRGRDPWRNEGELRQSANAALRAILGGSGDENRAREWDDYWRDNRQKLMAAAKTTWWVKATAQRQVTGPGEKPPSDALAVVTRVTDPQPPKPEKKKKK